MPEPKSSVPSGRGRWASADLPGYQFVREIGQGAIGSVHLARQIALDRQVAIKWIVGGAASQDPGTVLRFRRESRLLARLEHPGIVQVYELLEVGGDLFVVMEHVPGGDLRRLVAAGPPAPEGAVRTVVEIAAALDHAHERGVLHRDVKPSNVLVRADGVLKVGDFGVARLLERQARFAARPGLPPGTPGYMAPEVARGDLAIDRRADVYSLGVMAYEMLVGRLPFPVDPEDVYAMVRAQVERQPPTPRSLVPGFPPLLEAALLWALQKQPERRPATAGEFAAALKDALGRAPEPDDPGDWPARARPAARGVEAGAGPARPATRRRGRLLRLLGPGLAGVAALGALGLLAARLAAPAPTPAPALRVTSVTVAAPGGGMVGHCPHATFTIVATIATNGAAGEIDYRWLRPDGADGPDGRASVRAGARETAVALTVDFDGSTATRGLAALHVTSPLDVYSPPTAVTYACP